MLNSRLNENSDMLLGVFGGITAMSDTAKKRVLRKYRRRPTKRGTAPSDATGEPPKKGGILAALRRSPLVGADLNFTRLRDAGRKVDF